MLFGHINKALFIFLGAALYAASDFILLWIVGGDSWMVQRLPAGTWYIVAAILAPVGLMLQDVVADAMSIKAAIETENGAQAAVALRSSHVTMHTLSRIASFIGAIISGIFNLYIFDRLESVVGGDRTDTYLFILRTALFIPVISVGGVVLNWVLKQRIRLDGNSPLALAGTRQLAHAGGPVHCPFIFWGSVYVCLVVVSGLSQQISSSTWWRADDRTFLSTNLNLREEMVFSFLSLFASA